MAKMTLNEQADRILEMAEANGVQTNFFFVTTFKRYQVQINILVDLEKQLKGEDVTISKEYVKGRKNLYTNPAIRAYNQTTDSANKTVTTLLKIVQGWKKEDAGNDIDPLMAIINGVTN